MGRNRRQRPVPPYRPERLSSGFHPGMRQSDHALLRLVPGALSLERSSLPGRRIRRRICHSRRGRAAVSGGLHPAGGLSGRHAGPFPQQSQAPARGLFQNRAIQYLDGIYLLSHPGGRFEIRPEISGTRLCPGDFHHRRGLAQPLRRLGIRLCPVPQPQKDGGRTA